MNPQFHVHVSAFDAKEKLESVFSRSNQVIVFQYFECSKNDIRKNL